MFMTAVVGWIYMFLSISFFALNFGLLLTLLKHTEYQTGSYRIIKHICVANMAQLVSFTAGAVMTLTETVFLDKEFGTLIQSAWFLYLGLTLTLAVDRLLIFICSRSSKYWCVTVTLLAISWLFCFVMALMLCLPNFGYTYVSLYVWMADEKPGSQMMAMLEPYFDLSIAAIILIIYFVVLGHLLKITNGTLNAEIRIFFIAVLSFSYESIAIVCVFWVLPLISDATTALIAFNLSWIVECGFFPMVTLTINGSLRRKMIGCISPMSTTTVVTSFRCR